MAGRILVPRLGSEPRPSNESRESYPLDCLLFSSSVTLPRTLSAQLEDKV